MQSIPQTGKSHQGLAFLMGLVQSTREATYLDQHKCQSEEEGSLEWTLDRGGSEYHSIYMKLSFVIIIK